ncbi:MAG: hypothetical protein CVU59_09995 [Deltaproteobacteria bacterium HGW-Deltaproteobacteria-17]|nr:MAG: hypothetical protein CVU59_09995 [Deltaproteobacteria bacterium HGW-Deltaproteobacteria-17]
MPPTNPTTKPFTGTERFEVLSVIGKGGMGVVYEVFDWERQTKVALKTLNEGSPGELLRLKTEFRALQELEHPNMVQLGELFEDDGQWFFTMEIVHGVDFLKWVRTRDERPDPSLFEETTELEPHADPFRRLRIYVNEPRLRAALLQLASALEALHACGRVHRDIKPGNILVEKDGRVVLLDFGLVTQADPGQLSLEQFHPVGTAAYMSPEQASSMPVGPEADWYAVGALLYEALTDRHPFTGSFNQLLLAKQYQAPARPRELNPGISPDLDELCMALLQHDPARRPRVEEVIRSLRSHQSPTVSPTQTMGTRVPVFVGRKGELQRLLSAYEEVSTNGFGMMLLHGASGLGKSELLRACGREILAREQHASVLWGRCNERESLSYKAFDGVVDALSRTLLRLSDTELGQLIPRNMDLLARVFPVLGYLREVDASGAVRPRQLLDLQEVRSLAFQALRELLTRLADRRPVVIVLDDIQWADEDSLRLLRAILQPPDPPPLLLVISMRTSTDPDEAAEAVAHFQALLPFPANDLPLAPLSMDAAAALAEELLASNSDTAVPDATQAAIIAQEAAGHPLFIHELVHHIQNRPTDGIHKILRLDDVLWERISDLEEPLRRLVEIVSISFGPLRQEIVAMALGLHPAEIFRMAARLRVLHLLRTSGPGPEDLVEPYHDRVREAVQARMEDGARLAAHRSLVKVLRAMRNVEPERLAAHLEIIGEKAQASELISEAADQASSALAFNRAADLYKDAIGLRREDGQDADPESLRDLFIQMGTALANAGRGRDAAYAFLEALPGSRPVEAVELKRKAANQLLLSGFIDEGLVLTDQILDAVGKRMPKSTIGILSALLWGRFRVRMAGSRYRERDETRIPPADIVYVDILKSIALGLGGADHIRGAYFNTRFLSAALKLGEPSRVLNALCAEANYAAANAPDSGHARAILASCERIQQRLHDPQSDMYIDGAHAFASFMRGHWADARRHSEDFIRNSMQYNGTAWERDLMNNQVVWCLFYLGEFDEMTRRSTMVLQDALERGDLFGSAGMVLGLGNIVILNRDGPAAAAREIDALMARWSINGYHLQHYWALLSRVNLAIYSGDAQGAHERIWQEWPRLKRSLLTQIPAVRHEGLHVRARATLARAASETGRVRIRLLRQARKDTATLLAVKLPWVRSLGLLLDAAVHLQSGDRNAALSLLAQSITLLETCGMQLYAAAARVRLGRLAGGPDGSAMVQAAVDFMLSQGINDPGRMTELLATGFNE